MGEVGIKLRENETDWRDLESVIDDIAKSWGNYTDIQKNAIATSVAGVRQAENFRALMSSYGRAMDLAGESADSAGLAMEKFGVYTGGLEAKINALKSSWDAIIYNEDVINWFNRLIDFAQQSINVFGAFSGEIITFSTVLLGLFTTNSAMKNVGKFSDILRDVHAASKLATADILSFATAGKAVTGATLPASAAVTTLATSMKLLAGVGVILAVIHVMSELIVTQEELRESIVEIDNEYNSLINTIQDMENELANNIARIKELTELLNSGDITIIEQAELDKLKQSNQLLERQIELEQMKADLLKEEKQEQYSVLGRDYENGNKVSSGIGEYKEANQAQSMILPTYLDEAVDSINQNAIDAREELLQQAEDLLMLASAYDETTDSYKNYMSQYEDIMMALDEEAHLRDKLSKSLNTLSDDQKWYLSYLAQNNKLTQSEIDQYPELISYLDKHGFALKDIASELLNISTATDDVSGSMETYMDIYNDFATKYSSISGIVHNYNQETGFSIEQLQEIIGLYPDLADEVDSYMQGLITSQDLFKSLQESYKNDIENYKNRVWSKRLLDDEYYKSVVSEIEDIVEKHLEGYDIDLENARNLAEAKLKINAEMFQKMGINADKYYNSEAGAFTSEYQDLQKAGSILFKDSGNPFSMAFGQFTSEMEAYAAAIEEMKNISLEGITFDSDDSMFGGFISELDKEITDLADSTVESQSEIDERLVDLVIEMLKHELEMKKEALEEELEDLEEAHDKKIELIEEERDAVIDAIEDEIQAYEDLIDAKLESIQEDSDTRDYDNELEERSQSIADLEKQIASLSYDDSVDATKQRLELEEQLAEEKAELEDFQYDREKDLKEDGLEDELDRYTKDKEALIESENAKYDYQIKMLEQEFEATQEHYENLIEELEDQLEKEGILRQQALDLIYNDTENLYDRLINWNSIYGSDSIETVNEIWDAFWNMSSGVVSGLDNIGNTATTTNDKLAQLAQTLQQVDALGDIDVDLNNPQYPSINPDDYPDLSDRFPEYHDGGYVGNDWSKTLFSSLESGLNSDEIFAKLQTGEFVATKKHQQTITDLVSKSIYSSDFDSNKSLGGIGTLMEVTVQGNLDESVIPKLESLSNDLFKKINKSMSSRGVVRNAKVNVI